MTAINRNTIGIVLFGLLLTLGACQFLENTDPKYQEASQFINTIADKLGRTKDNQISSRHLQSPWGALYSYNYIEIIFSTDVDSSQLSAQLGNLESAMNEKGIVLEYAIPSGPDTYSLESLQRSGLALTLNNLSFKPGEIHHSEDMPRITRWIYKSGKALSALEIDLMEPNAKGDKWMYSDKTINGNIVTLTLELSRF